MIKVTLKSGSVRSDSANWNRLRSIFGFFSALFPLPQRFAPSTKRRVSRVCGPVRSSVILLTGERISVLFRFER